MEAITIPRPAGPPGWRCGWLVSDDGSAVIWDGVGKFLDGADWLVWLRQHALGDRQLTGVAFAIGETLDWFDLWRVDAGIDGVTALRYPVPRFDPERWDDFEDSGDYVPDHFHTAMYSLDDTSVAVREMRPSSQHSSLTRPLSAERWRGSWPTWSTSASHRRRFVRRFRADRLAAQAPAAR